MIRKISLTVTSLLGLAAATGFAADKTYTFGIVAKSNNNPVFQAAKTGAEDEAAKLSKEKGVTIKIDWRTPNEEDPQKQADALEQLVNAGASGIAVSCSDANKLTDAINSAVDKGVPVVCFDSDAPKSKRLADFGTDDIDCGQKTMSELAKAMGKRELSPSWQETRTHRTCKSGFKAPGKKPRSIPTLRSLMLTITRKHLRMPLLRSSK